MRLACTSEFSSALFESLTELEEFMEDTWPGMEKRINERMDQVCQCARLEILPGLPFCHSLSSLIRSCRRCLLPCRLASCFLLPLDPLFKITVVNPLPSMHVILVPALCNNQDFVFLFRVLYVQFVCSFCL